MSHKQYEYNVALKNGSHNSLYSHFLVHTRICIYVGENRKRNRWKYFLWRLFVDIKIMSTKHPQYPTKHNTWGKYFIDKPLENALKVNFRIWKKKKFIDLILTLITIFKILSFFFNRNDHPSDFLSFLRKPNLFPFILLHISSYPLFLKNPNNPSSTQITTPLPPFRTIRGVMSNPKIDRLNWAEK